MKRFSSTLRLLRRNWKALLGFETLYRLAVSGLAVPLLFGIFSLTVRAAGLTYLSTESVKAYLLNPVTVVGLFLILMLTAFLSLFEMQAVICCCHASHLDKKITLWAMARAGAANGKRLLFPRNWLLIVFVVLIVPLTNAAAVSGLISQIELPEFIQDYINANKLLYALRVGVIAVLSLLALRWCLSLHAFTLEKRSFVSACRESARLTKKHIVSIAVGTGVVGFLLQLLLILCGCALVGLGFVGVYFLCPDRLQYAVASVIMLGTLSVGAYLSAAFVVPVAFAYLSVRYYEGQPESQPETDEGNLALTPRNKRVAALVCTVLCAAILGSAALQAYHAKALSREAESVLHLPEIAAHRGSSTSAPENSLPAFRQAIEDGADWIELDVHQTKDGVVVVAHDESLKRIAGVSQNVWALTYDELQQYDVGSWFSPEYADLRMATLDEVLKLCKGKIKLNIELKPTGHEPDFEQHVLDVIHENGFEKGEYVLASLNAGALETLKRLEPETPTLYIMTIAAGNIKDIAFADAFSVEESSVTQRLVTSVHAADKQLHVWTVNRSDNVEKMMELNVDCIISDDPLMARSALMAAPLSDDLQTMVGWIFPEAAEQTAAQQEQAIFAGASWQTRQRAARNR